MNIVLLTNILTPYRKAFFDELYSQCIAHKNGNFKVLCMAETESNRQWRYDEYKEKYTSLLSGRTISIKGIDIHFCKNVAKEIQACSPDVLIVAGSYMLPPAWKAVKYARKNNIKVLFWSESHLDEERDYNGGTLSIREYIRSNFYKKFDGFLYPGRKAKEFIERYAAEGAKYYNLPNLINNQKFDIKGKEFSRAILRDKYGIDQCKYIFILPARLSKAKGIIPFLDVCAKAKLKGRFQILIAGEGEQRNEIEEKAKELGLDVLMLGYRGEAEMIELYRSADCFLLPSISDPNPLTCIEALWNGLPLLVSEHVGNYPEVVKKAENGYVFSYKKTGEAAAYIDMLLESNSEWRTHASQMSYAIARKRFDIRKRTEMLLDELNGNN